MGSYVLDAAAYKEGAFTAAWLTCGTANMAMLASALLPGGAAAGEQQSAVLTALVLLMSTATFCLTGAMSAAGL